MIDVRDYVRDSGITDQIQSIARECRCSETDVLDAIKLVMESRDTNEEVEEYVLSCYASRPGGRSSMLIVRNALARCHGITSVNAAQANIESIMRMCVVADAAEALAVSLYCFDADKSNNADLCFEACAKHTEYKTKDDYMDHMSELISEVLYD